jgi:hypothetical protein
VPCVFHLFIDAVSDINYVTKYLDEKRITSWEVMSGVFVS